MKNSVNREKERESPLKLYIADEEIMGGKENSNFNQIPIIKNEYYANTHWKLPSSEDTLDSELDELLKDYE